MRKAYPEYKDSGIEWLGEIPAHWQLRKVKYVFRVFNGATPKSSEPVYWDGDIAWLTPEDMGELTSHLITDTARRISKEGYKNCGTNLVPEGSLVLSTRAPIGHIAIAGIPLCTNQGCRSLVFKRNDDRKYFYYALYAAKQNLQAGGQGSTFLELSKEKLEMMQIIDLGYNEQCKISRFLDRQTSVIDKLISCKEKQIELLKEKRAAIITWAVTRGLDSNVPMKDSGIEWLGEIPAHWDIKRIKFLVSEPLRYGANEEAKYIDPNQPRFVRITDINEKGDLDDSTFRSLPLASAQSYLLQSGDILLARSGATVGKSFLYKESWGSCCFAGYLIRARLNNKKCLPAFFNYFTGSTAYWNWISSSLIQATIQNVSAEKYDNLVIGLPPLDEQEATIEYLDQETSRIDVLISKIQSSIEKLQEYRTALISAAVTGKIDVRGE